jgi:hypothetical protein
VTGRLWNRFTYWLERTVVRGAQYRLLLIAALIGIIAMFGGWAVVAAGTGFDRPAEAVWWAFLRLTDPGYLGDDVGTFNRTVSTVLTVLGYVIFLGALVAVMTQWLNSRMMRLEQGLTPVARNDHVLILGLNNRTDSIVREVLLSEERVRRFLTRHGTRALHIVVMADGVDASVVQDLRDAVGDAWDERKVTLRSGTPLRVEHLSRVDIRHAAVIIVPGSEFDVGGAERTDSWTVKTLLSLASELSPEEGGPRHEPSVDRSTWPLVVAEIFDARKIPIARKAYPGPLEILASDAIISRLIAQNIRHRGLSHVFNEILTHDDEGSEIYIREHPELDGLTFDRLGGAFDTSILLGVLREGAGGLEAHLNPRPGFTVRATDRFVHLAEDYAQARYSGQLSDHPWPRGEPRTIEHGRRDKRVLILGWSPKVPTLIQEFGTYGDDGFEVVVLSSMSAAARERALERHGGISGRVVTRQVEGDYTEISDLTAIAPHEYDTVLVVGSDRRQGEEESDARTIVGSLLLNEMGLPTGRTQTILELLDPENVRLLDSTRSEVLISPLVLSHMLAHVALRPELGTVFGEIFTAGGAEIAFRTLRAYLPEGHQGASFTFGDVQRAAHAAGEVALGIQSGPTAADLVLGPGRDHPIPVDAGVLVVTMVTY